MTPVRAIGADGETFDFGGFGVAWKIDGEETDQRFSVVHHPLAPHALAGRFIATTTKKTSCRTS